MKYIVAMIKPDRFEEVQRLLFESNINLMTVSEVLGCGRQKGITTIYRGRAEAGNLLRKIKLEIAVNDDFVEKTIAAINKGAHSGNVGDGKIFVLNLDDCVRISSGETGSVAIG